jgi:hypothetical protein
MQNTITNNSNNINNEKNSLQKKVPLLVNNLQTMYNQNTERVKKRSEQMKKRKVQLDHEIEGGVLPCLKAEKVNVVSENHDINQLKLNQKVYLEESDIHCLHNEPKEPYSLQSSNKISQKDSTNILNSETEKDNNLEYYDENETEILVSDLEGDFEDVEEKQSLSNIITTNTKSFIPLQNHLRSKKAIPNDKATPSYLMALYGYEENEEENSLNSNSQLSREENSPIITSNKHNYNVDDIIEEETSENNSESEVNSRKRSAAFKRSSSDISNPFASPKLKMKYYSAGKESIESINNINDIKDKIVHSFNNMSEKTLGLNKINLHKNSKSEYINIHIDIQKILENIEKKRLEEHECRLDKIALRKSVLLNNFFKSNSLHNLPHKLPISGESTGQIQSVKKYSICTSSSINLDNVFKKLSPSSISRAFYYDKNDFTDAKVKNEIGDQEGEQKLPKEEENNFINFDYYQEEEQDNLLDKNNSVIQNNSIIEISDEKSYQTLENEIFMFNPSPQLKSELPNEKKISIFESEDFNLKDENPQHIIQDTIRKMSSTSSQNEINNNLDTLKNLGPSKKEIIGKKRNRYNSNEEIKEELLTEENNYLTCNSLKIKSIDLREYQSDNQILQEDLPRQNTLPNQRKSFDLKIISNTNFEIITETKNFFTQQNSEDILVTPFRTQRKEIRSELSLSKSKSKSKIRRIYNNNYINNNINNISISIVNQEGNKIKSFHKPKINSIHSLSNNIKNIYKKHMKNISINNFTTKPVIEVDENKNFDDKTDRNRSINSNKNIRKTSLTNNSNTSRSNTITTAPNINTLNRSTKGDLKHYLTYSDTAKIDLTSSNTFLSRPFNTNVSQQSISNFYANTSSSLSNSVMNTQINNDYLNIRVNSESSINSFLSSSTSSNKKTIIDAMKFLKFQSSSLDHQKFSLERLFRSKAKNFCLLINEIRENNKIIHVFYLFNI